MIDFAKFDSKKLAREIDDFNLDDKIKNYSEISEKYDLFHKNIIEVINNNAPIREQTKREMKRKKKPWITKGILKSIKTKNILLKQFLRNKDRLIYV